MGFFLTKDAPGRLKARKASACEWVQVLKKTERCGQYLLAFRMRNGQIMISLGIRASFKGCGFKARTKINHSAENIKIGGLNFS